MKSFGRWCQQLSSWVLAVPSPILRRIFFAPQIVSELHQDRAKSAGKKSGKSRKARAENTWKPHALQLAIATRKTNPTLSQESLADKILAKWGQDVQPIGRRSLIDFISQRERTGEIQKRKQIEREFPG